jgi:LDH2 family malate/lactate/ureidoglycolate dehydrogenase
MVLYGGAQRFFGANPWSISVPSDEAPIVFDGSTSAIAEGKVRFARAKGTPLPAGCIQDKDGNPTADPEDFYAGGALLPLGGAVAGHKGFGLAMASSLVSGLAMIGDPDHSLIGASSVAESADKRGQIAGVFLVVVDPAAFGDPRQYRSLVGENVRAARRIQPARGVQRITLPGEPEIRAREQRTADGVALPEATWQELEGIGDRFGVRRPEHSPA